MKSLVRSFLKPNDINLHLVYCHLVNGGLDELSDIEVKREDVQLETELGEGQFGSVLRARLTVASGELMVAAKLLKNNSDDNTTLAFMQEAQRLKSLDHPHVVKIVASHFARRPRMLFVELMKSDVKHYLRANRPLCERAALISNVEQLAILLQVSDGLAYLARNRAVHRDIAAVCVYATTWALICPLTEKYLDWRWWNL